MPPPRRSAPTRRRVVEPRRQMLVFTEGERTEDDYLVHWRRRYRDNVLVNIDPFHGVPMSLVDRAATVKREEAREQRRGRGRAHDEIWCVFDRDLHPNLPAAIDRAAANGISVVLSNPCIELWFILHFADQAAHLERDEAQRRSRDLLGCDKALTAKALESLVDLHPAAMSRAQALDAKHRDDGSPPSSATVRAPPAVWRRT
ncbi:MAG: RloB family protein [Rhodococcus sp. (in: high G+C Gram-positive bacteria)]